MLSVAALWIMRHLLCLITVPKLVLMLVWSITPPLARLLRATRAPQGATRKSQDGMRVRLQNAEPRAMEARGLSDNQGHMEVVLPVALEMPTNLPEARHYLEVLRCPLPNM